MYYLGPEVHKKTTSHHMNDTRWLCVTERQDRFKALGEGGVGLNAGWPGRSVWSRRSFPRWIHDRLLPNADRVKVESRSALYLGISEFGMNRVGLLLSLHRDERPEFMEFKDLVATYFDRSNAMQAQWGAFITIALGLLAVFASLKPSSRKTLLAVVLSLGFMAFAYENYDALYDIARARIATRDLIRTSVGRDAAQQAIINSIKPTITPPPILGLQIFHGILDCVVLAAIWGLTLIKERTRDGQLS